MSVRRTVSFLLTLACICLPANAAQTHRFSPQGCEFSAVLFNEPVYHVQWSGERRITVAISRTQGGAMMRASCGSWFIEDQRAFRDHLRPQLQRAARHAGLKEYDVSIQKGRLGTVASFWGFRGEGRLRTWYRSDTYVGKHSFLELVVHSRPQERHRHQFAAFRSSVRR